MGHTYARKLMSPAYPPAPKTGHGPDMHEFGLPPFESDNPIPVIPTSVRPEDVVALGGPDTSLPKPKPKNETQPAADAEAAHTQSQEKVGPIKAFIGRLAVKHGIPDKIRKHASTKNQLAAASAYYATHSDDKLPVHLQLPTNASRRHHKKLFQAKHKAHRHRVKVAEMQIRQRFLEDSSIANFAPHTPWHMTQQMAAHKNPAGLKPIKFDPSNRAHVEGNPINVNKLLAMQHYWDEAKKEASKKRDGLTVDITTELIRGPKRHPMTGQIMVDENGNPEIGVIDKKVTIISPTEKTKSLSEDELRAGLSELRDSGLGILPKDISRDPNNKNNDARSDAVWKNFEKRILEEEAAFQKDGTKKSLEPKILANLDERIEASTDEAEKASLQKLRLTFARYTAYWKKMDAIGPRPESDYRNPELAWKRIALIRNPRLRASNEKNYRDWLELQRKQEILYVKMAKRAAKVHNGKTADRLEHWNRQGQQTARAQRRAEATTRIMRRPVRDTRRPS